MTQSKTTTAAPKAKKAPAVSKAAKKMDAVEFLANQIEEGEIEEEGKIACILALHIAGYTKKEIVEAGYNRSTVYRQVGDFEKMKKAPLTSYFGYDLYEGRIQKIMSRKKCSRDKAVELIAQMDMKG